MSGSSDNSAPERPLLVLSTEIYSDNGGLHDSGRPFSCHPAWDGFWGVLYTRPWNADLVLKGLKSPLPVRRGSDGADEEIRRDGLTRIRPKVTGYGYPGAYR